jgi:hypothetical protein
MTQSTDQRYDWTRQLSTEVRSVITIVPQALRPSQ